MVTGKWDKALMVILSMILPLNFYLIYRFPASNNTLAFIGFGVLGVGVLFFVLSLVTLALKRGEGIVTSGIYGVVRNPMYLGGMLMFLSHMFLGQGAIVKITAIVAVICCYLEAFSEDAKGIRKFGDGYRRYMESVPRMNIILGLVRRICGTFHK